jgi:hypothetical protein
MWKSMPQVITSNVAVESSFQRLLRKTHDDFRLKDYNTNCALELYHEIRRGWTLTAHLFLSYSTA